MLLPKLGLIFPVLLIFQQSLICDARDTISEEDPFGKLLSKLEEIPQLLQGALVQKLATVPEEILNKNKNKKTEKDGESSAYSLVPTSESIGGSSNILELLNKRKEKENKEKSEHKNLDGPHICVREAKSVLEPWYITWTGARKQKPTCQNYHDAFVCSSPQSNGKTTQRIQECCDGYKTDDIQKNGCNKEITDELHQTFSIPGIGLPQNTTVLFSSLGKAPYLLPGIQNIYGWDNHQILNNSDSTQKFLVTIKHEDSSTEIYLNCARKNSTIRTENLQILTFDKDLEPASDNLLDAIKKESRLSTFLSLLGEDLRKFLTETKKGTVFAFTNEAFEKLSEKTKQRLLNPDKNGCDQEYIKHHITTRDSECSEDLYFGIRNMLDKLIDIEKNKETSEIKIGNATIIHPDIFALNGVLHIIDKVLVRDDYLSWTDTVSLYNPELVEQLENETIVLPVTVFVGPKNITNPLNYIVSNQSISNFRGVTSFKTDANSTIFTHSHGERLLCSRFTRPAIKSCKSIIYFIDEPLPIVQHNIDEFLASRTDLSKFYRLWQLSNVTSELDLITVFAPNNAAFSENFFMKIQKSQKKIDDFLKRHITTSVLCESDIQKSSKGHGYEEYRALNGDQLSPNVEDNMIGVNTARLEEMGLIQSNGIVHIIDSFIEQPKETCNSGGDQSFTFNFGSKPSSGEGSGKNKSPFGSSLATSLLSSFMGGLPSFGQKMGGVPSSPLASMMSPNPLISMMSLLTPSLALSGLGNSGTSPFGKISMERKRLESTSTVPPTSTSSPSRYSMSGSKFENLEPIQSTTTVPPTSSNSSIKRFSKLDKHLDALMDIMSSPRVFTTTVSPPSSDLTGGMSAFANVMESLSKHRKSSSSNAPIPPSLASPSSVTPKSPRPEFSSIFKDIFGNMMSKLKKMNSELDKIESEGSGSGEEPKVAKSEKSEKSEKTTTELLT